MIERNKKNMNVKVRDMDNRIKINKFNRSVRLIFALLDGGWGKSNSQSDGGLHFSKTDGRHQSVGSINYT